MKALSQETERIVNELRRQKTAFEILFGIDNAKPSVTYAMGQAISRLCQLDVERTRQADEIQELKRQQGELSL